MSAAAASVPTGVDSMTGRRRDDDDDDGGGGGSPPAAKRPAVMECDCAKCELRGEIEAMLEAAMEILDTEGAMFTVNASAKAARRVALWRIRVSVSQFQDQMYKFLPNITLMHRKHRDDYYRVRTRCQADDSDEDAEDADFVAHMSPSAAFDHFHALVSDKLTFLRNLIKHASNGGYDQALIEHGTVAHIVMRTCNGLQLCKIMSEQLVALAQPLQNMIEDLKKMATPRECSMLRTRTRVLQAAAADDDDDNGGEAVALQIAEQDPRAETEAEAYQF